MHTDDERATKDKKVKVRVIMTSRKRKADLLLMAALVVATMAAVAAVAAVGTEALTPVAEDPSLLLPPPREEGARRDREMKFVFVKTHKTGSSTLMVMLGQALEKRGLYPAFGKVGPCLTCLAYPNEFTSPDQQLIGPAKTNFSAVLSHLRYTEASRATIARYLGEDAPVFTLLRDPLTRFVSALRFFGCPRARQEGVDYHRMHDADMNLMLDLLQDKEFMSGFGPNFGGLVPLNYPTILGITTDPFLSRHEFKREFDKARRRIGLALITEEWHLSMALLRRYIGLDLGDFIWNNQKSHHRAPLELSDKTRARVREVLWMEYEIYDYYRAEFAKLITPEIEQEAEIIKRHEEQYKQRCAENIKHCVRREDDRPFFARRLEDKEREFGHSE